MHPSLLRALLEGLVRNNPLFLVSALVLLIGAWLLNPPAIGGGRERGAVLTLLVAVKAYELTLLGAAYVLSRRGGLTRDVRNLVLVLAPFLLDVSCTDALAVEQTGTWGGHLLGIAALVAVAAGQAVVAARLVGRRYDALTWGVLLAGPVVAHLLPLAQSFAAHAGLAPSEAALASGLGLAALIGAVCHGATRPGGADLRALAPILLGVAGYHAGATTWTHDGSLLLVAGPASIVAGPLLPRLLWPTLAAERLVAVERWSSFVLPAVGALACGLPGLFTGHEPVLGLTAWQVGLMGVAVVHGLVAVRGRSLPHALGLMLAVDLAGGGASLDRSFAALGSGAVEPALLLAAFAWGVVRGAHPAVLAVPLTLAAGCIYRLHLAALLPAGAPLDAALALDVVGLGVLAWAQRVHGGSPAAAGWRLLGVLLLVAPVYIEMSWDLPEAGAALLGRSTVAGLLVAAVALRQRTFALPALLLPAEAARALAPTGSTGWGGLVMASAFVLVGAGVVVSLKREALLAWLDARAAAAGGDGDGDEAPTPAPASASPSVGASAGRLVGATALALVAIALALPNVVSGKHGYGRSGESYAIGSLRTLASAQAIFREGDKDDDGVLDYARGLGELERAQLIGGTLAKGVGNGYRIQLTASPEQPELLWMAVASPLEPGVGRSLFINQSGVIYYGPGPFVLDPSCQPPTGAVCLGGK
jgi:hypothetical protein